MKAARISVAGAAVLLFALPVHVAGMRLFNEAALPVALAVGVGTLVMGIDNLVRRDVLVLAIGALFSALFLAITAAASPANPALKDVVEAVKPCFYAVFVVVGALWARSFSGLSILKAVLAAGVMSVVHSAMVYVPVLNGTVDLWKGRQSTDSWNFHFYRFSGTVAYPDILGMWLVLAGMCGVSLMLRDDVRKSTTLIATLTVFIGLVLTGSRGALVVGIVCALVYVLARRSEIGVRRILVGAVVTAVASLVVVAVSGDSVAGPIAYIRIGLQEGLLDGSFLHRVREFQVLAELMTQGRVLGAGPQTALLAQAYGPVESGLFYYLYKFGVVGLLFLLTLMCAAGRGFYLGMSNDVWRDEFAFAFGIWALVTVVVGGISMSITEEYKSFFFFFASLGILVEQVTRVAARRTVAAGQSSGVAQGE